jgi:SAM-dependent methyltransferase
MALKDRIRKLDDEYAHGAVRRWYNRNAVLGGKWGEFMELAGSVPDGATVLDLGAGEAELRSRYPRARYVAIDRGIGHAGWDYSALDVVSDATAVPLRDQCVDLIVCKQVLEHIAEPVTLLREARRVLRPGGRILLSTNQAWPQHQKPYDFFRFTVDRLEAMGGAFTAALFHATQTLSPHLYTRTARAARWYSIVMRPLLWLMRALIPLVTTLDKLDRTKDNTLGWYVLATRES